MLQFLWVLFSRGLSYSAINTARSALSAVVSIDNTPIGQHRLVTRFLKSVFEQRPALPKNVVVWDASQVLNYLRSLSPVARISTKLLTLKLTMLILLLSGQRQQTVQYFDVRNMTLTYSKVSFRIGEKVKQTKVGRHVQEITFRAYAPDRRLCIVTVLKAYLQRTLLVRGKETRLLLTYGRPIHAASRATIRRWVTEVLVAAGIDTRIFTPHSTRAASTSKAAAHVPLSTILAAAGWRTECTFRAYYDKPIDTSGDFGSAVLEANLKKKKH